MYPIPRPSFLQGFFSLEPLDVSIYRKRAMKRLFALRRASSGLIRKKRATLTMVNNTSPNSCSIAAFVSGSCTEGRGVGEAGGCRLQFLQFFVKFFKHLFGRLPVKPDARRSFLNLMGSQQGGQ